MYSYRLSAHIEILTRVHFNRKKSKTQKHAEERERENEIKNYMHKTSCYQLMNLIRMVNWKHTLLIYEQMEKKRM